MSLVEPCILSYKSMRSVYCNFRRDVYGEYLIVPCDIDRYLNSPVDTITSYYNFISTVNLERSGYCSVIFMEIPFTILSDIYFLHKFESVSGSRIVLIVEQNELLVDGCDYQTYLGRLLSVVNSFGYQIWLGNVEWEVDDHRIINLVKQYEWAGITLKMPCLTESEIHRFMEMIDLCKKNEMKTLVTNVDSRLQFEYAVKNGVDFSQGFYF